jgi:hypothetical protein
MTGSKRSELMIEFGFEIDVLCIWEITSIWDSTERCSGRFMTVLPRSSTFG